jgi:hypothetical protein
MVAGGCSSPGRGRTSSDGAAGSAGLGAAASSGFGGAGSGGFASIGSDGGGAASDELDAGGAGEDLATGSLDGRSGPGDGGPGGGPGGATVCDPATPSIGLSSGQVQGVLTGQSRNATASCQSRSSTPGPDAFFSLSLDEFTIVDLSVDAPVDAVVIVRSGCGAAALELGCGAATLRVALRAGTYTVIVDTASLGALDAAPFTLTATAAPPAANATCARATFVDGTAPRMHGELDQGGAPAVACGVTADSSALYYAIEVPPAHQLTVTADVTAGGHAWTPRIAAVSACGATSCLAKDKTVPHASAELDWVNDGAGTELVVFSVSADTPVTGAAFDLGFGLTDLRATCAAPTPVGDGTVLVDQSLANAPPATISACGQPGQPALYYVVTVLPGEQLDVSTTGKSSALIGIPSSCDDRCSGGSSTAWTRVNLTSEPQTLLLEVMGGSVPFDLKVVKPRAPAGILATPSSPLVTSEGGGQATMQVVLVSTPTATVTVPISSSRPSEGTPSPTALVFDATNWNQPQTVTITGVDDQVSDGAQAYTILTGPAVSDDPMYAGLRAETLPLTNLDDDPSLVVEGGDDVVTSEDGTSATFTIRLAVPPTDTVTVPLASSDAGEGAVSPTTLTFTPASWNVPQVVTVTGVDDAVTDGTRAYAIDVGPLASADARYAGLTPAAVVAHNRDNDFAAGTTTVALGSDACGVAGTPNQYPLAMDALGKLYTVVDCADQLELFTSDDGGKTVAGPFAIPGASKFGGDFAIAAGRGGKAALAYGFNIRGIQLARTTDGGATWFERQLLSGDADLLRVAAARDTVVIVGDNPNGSGTVVLASDDAGLSFRAPWILASGQMVALGLQPDGKAAWLVDDASSLFASGDGGATFKTLGLVAGPGQNCCYVAGASDLYAVAPGVVTVTSLADPTNSASFTGPSGHPLAAALDDAGVVTIFSPDLTQGLLASRFSADGQVSAATTVGAIPSLGGAVALSHHATAVVSIAGSTLTFAILTWP